MKHKKARARKILEPLDRTALEFVSYCCGTFLADQEPLSDHIDAVLELLELEEISFDDIQRLADQTKE